MNFPKFQRLVEERAGFATMSDPTASGEYFSDSCGDMYTFYLKVGRGEIIEDVSYFTTGCGFGTATSSIVVELARGKTVDEAEALTEAEIEAELDGYPEKKKDYPGRSLAALHAAIADYRAKRASGAITDEMLDRTSALAAAERAVAPPPDSTSGAASSSASDGGVITIKLH